MILCSTSFIVTIMWLWDYTQILIFDYIVSLYQFSIECRQEHPLFATRIQQHQIRYLSNLGIIDASSHMITMHDYWNDILMNHSIVSCSNCSKVIIAWFKTHDGIYGKCENHRMWTNTTYLICSFKLLWWFKMGIMLWRALR